MKTQAVNSRDITSTGSNLDKTEHEDAGCEQLGHHQHRHRANLDKTEHEYEGDEQLGHHQHWVPPRQSRI